MTHKFHRNCITTEMINIAKMNPKQASIACDEANRLGLVGKYTLSGIIEKVGPMSAAAYDVYRAARTDVGFKPNSTNSKQLNRDPSQIPDKQYAISNYESVDDCINNPMTGLVSLGVDYSRARQECESYFGDKLSNSEQKTVGGTSWTTPKIVTKPNAVVTRGEGARVLAANQLKNASAKINAQTKEYYSNTPKVRNASVVVEREPEIPAYVIFSGLEREYMDYMRSTRTTNNIKSAAQERDHMIYMYQLHRGTSNHPESVNHVAGNLELEKMVEQKGRELNTINEIRRIKSGKKEYNPYEGMPAWYICSGGVL